MGNRIKNQFKMKTTIAVAALTSTLAFAASLD